MKDIMTAIKESVNLNLIVLIIAALAIIVVLDEKTSITLNSDGFFIEKKVPNANVEKEKNVCP